MVNIHTVSHLREALNQKEQALIQYVRYMRESEDSENHDIAALFADLAKAEEKHITVIRNQLAKYADKNLLNKYESINEYNSQHSTYRDAPEH